MTMIEWMQGSPWAQTLYLVGTFWLGFQVGRRLTRTGVHPQLRKGDWMTVEEVRKRRNEVRDVWCRKKDGEVALNLEFALYEDVLKAIREGTPHARALAAAALEAL